MVGRIAKTALRVAKAALLTLRDAASRSFKSILAPPLS